MTLFVALIVVILLGLVLLFLVTEFATWSVTGKPCRPYKSIEQELLEFIKNAKSNDFDRILSQYTGSYISSLPFSILGNFYYFNGVTNQRIVRWSPVYKAIKMRFKELEQSK